jgi:hypothetical protein
MSRPTPLPRVLAPAVAVLVLAAGVSAQSIPPPDTTLLGCFDLALGRWAPDEGLGLDSLDFAPPPRVLLEALPAGLPWSSESMQLRVAPGSVPSVHRFAAWSQPDPDSVRLSWSTGSAGVSVYLNTDSTPWRGLARTFSERADVTERITGAAATPVACDKPPDHPLWSIPYVLREIQLRNGEVVRLGRSLSLRVRRDFAKPVQDSTRYRLSIAGEGSFASADEIHVLMGRDGLVAGIWVRYPPETNFESLVHEFEVVMGIAPAREDTPLNNGVRIRTAAWVTRVTRLLVTLQEAEGRSMVTVFMRDPRL